MITGTSQFHRPSPDLQRHHSHSAPASRSDQEFNIVLHGVQECRQGLSKLARHEEDLKNTISSLSSVVDMVDENSIKYLKLGKFNLDSQKPRPILVKFIRTRDVVKVLSQASLASKPLVIKPNLSRSQTKGSATSEREVEINRARCRKEVYQVTQLHLNLCQ